MTALAPVDGAHERSADWHVEKLLDFTRKKAEIGEPSPHMTVVNWLSRDEAPAEALWRIGCYAVPYSLVSAIAIWSAMPWDRAKHAPDSMIEEWVAKWWPGIHTRTERRTVRSPQKFARSLISYRNWVAGKVPQKLLLRSDATYEDWWDAANSVDFFGRYISIRVIEAIRRASEMRGNPQPQMELPDIRGIGGHSPVRALTLFYPAVTAELLSPDWALAEKLAEDLHAALPGVSRYVLAAMLCEYREAFEDRHQYPARTLDQELEYANGRHAQFWEASGLAVRQQLFDARRELFPKEALGEIDNRWMGLRDDLARWLRDDGENWSDTLYDYTKVGLYTSDLLGGGFTWQGAG